MCEYPESFEQAIKNVESYFEEPDDSVYSMNARELCEYKMITLKRINRFTRMAASLTETIDEIHRLLSVM